jgi:hypothetical protein
VFAKNLRRASGALFIEPEMARGIDAQIERAAERFAINVRDAQSQKLVSVLAARRAGEDVQLQTS